MMSEFFRGQGEKAISANMKANTVLIETSSGGQGQMYLDGLR